MLKLSYSHDENAFAIPFDKYVVKTKSSPDLKIMTYLGDGKFKRDLFGIDIQGLQGIHIKPNETTERYVVPLDAIIKDKSYKDLMTKEEITKKDKTTYKYKEDYLFFEDFIRTAFNEIKNKIPAELVDGNDVLDENLDRDQLLETQVKMSLEIKIQDYLSKHKS